MEKVYDTVHGKRKQSCMMRECHELKGNTYIANWNLQLKLVINMFTSGEPQKKVWCDRESGGEPEKLSQHSIISKKSESLKCAIKCAIVLIPLTLKVAGLDFPLLANFVLAFVSSR